MEWIAWWWGCKVPHTQKKNCERFKVIFGYLLHWRSFGWCVNFYKFPILAFRFTELRLKERNTLNIFHFWERERGEQKKRVLGHELIYYGGNVDLASHWVILCRPPSNRTFAHTRSRSSRITCQELTELFFSTRFFSPCTTSGDFQSFQLLCGA